MGESPPFEVVLVKLGGSLLTDKTRPRTVRERALERIARELATAIEEGPQVDGRPFRIVLGHGSGSFGHVAAAEYGIADGVRDARGVEGVAATRIEALALHSIVLAALREAGLSPYSVVPGSLFVGASGEPRPLDLEPLVRALELGLLPVVFGDVVMDREQGASILSTEAVFEGLAARRSSELPIERALWLGVTEGIYDAEGETVRELDRGGLADLEDALEGAAGTDVTGGMRLRAEAALRLADRGVRSWIGNGRRPGILRDALVGYQVAGTLVEPRIP